MLRRSSSLHATYYTSSTVAKVLRPLTQRYLETGEGEIYIGLQYEVYRFFLHPWGSFQRGAFKFLWQISFDYSLIYDLLLNFTVSEEIVEWGQSRTASHLCKAEKHLFEIAR